MTRLLALAHALPLALALASAFAAPAGAAEPTDPAAATLKDHILVHGDDVEWGPCSPALPPGAQCGTIEGDPKAANKLFTFRAKLPDGWRIAPHFHPADEHLTVISGTFAMGLGKRIDAELHRMAAGSFMVMPKGSPHFAVAQGETVIQVHAIGPWGITYVNPADDPRNGKP